jgi:hypothetical protein
MIHEQRIADIERAMLEEHEKDLAALRRLKKYLPHEGSTSDTRATTVAVRPRNVPYPSLKAKVRELIDAEPHRHWMRSELASILREQHFPIAAQDKDASINQALRNLVRSESISLLIQGTGKAPSVYQSFLADNGEPATRAAADRAVRLLHRDEEEVDPIEM